MMAELLDGAILGWLVFTWFYEGHHKRCEVVVTCSVCGTTEDHKCDADPRNRKGKEQ